MNGEVKQESRWKRSAYVRKGYQRRPYKNFQLRKAGEDVNNQVDLFSGETLVERKTFVFDLKENPRGRFLKITEEVCGRRDSIIIPATGLHRFRELLERTIQANQDAGTPSPITR